MPSLALIGVPTEIVVTFWADHKTPSFLSAFVDGLNYIDELLLILENPVELVIITSTEIAHLDRILALLPELNRGCTYHVLVAEKKHQGDRIVKFVHLFKVWDLV